MVDLLQLDQETKEARGEITETFGKIRKFLEGDISEKGRRKGEELFEALRKLEDKIVEIEKKVKRAYVEEYGKAKKLG